MMENSIIFNPVNPLAEEKSQHIETVYESQDGYTKISRTTIDGKNVLLKSLKERYFGSPLYERLLKKEYEIGKGRGGSSGNTALSCDDISCIRCKTGGNKSLCHKAYLRTEFYTKSYEHYWRCSGCCTFQALLIGD